MEERLFRALLNLYMSSDPWPAGEWDQKHVLAGIEAESTRRGYSSWIDAFHQFEVTP